MNPFKIQGHEFTEDDSTCANCGQEYRDFLKNGGGCISTEPFVAKPLPEEPTSTIEQLVSSAQKNMMRNRAGRHKS